MKGDAGRGSLRALVALHLHGMERAADILGVGPDDDPSYDLLRVRGPAGDGLRLVFAVAGFGPGQLEIRVAGDQLSVDGEGTGDGDPGRLLHRGMAARRFRRVFRLAPELDAIAADIDRGLLTTALAPTGAAPADRIVAIRPPSP